MKHLSIQKTVDAYPGLSPEQRKRLAEEDRAIEKMKAEICKAFGWSYCGFSPEQIKQYHHQIFK